MKQLLLQTDNLQLIPLLHSQLVHYLRADGSLDEALGLVPVKRKVPPALLTLFEQVILPAVGDPARNPLYSTVWIVVARQTRSRVGDISFKGDPVAGELQISYSFSGDQYNEEWITEAVKAIGNWALEQPGVRSIGIPVDLRYSSTEVTALTSGRAAGEPIDLRPLSQPQDALYRQPA